MRIGVIGVGVVGGAVKAGFEKRGYAKVYAYDKHKPEYDDFPHILTCDVIFVCVPTPTIEYGDQDLTPLEEVFAMLKGKKYGGVICVKSTVLPGTCEELSKRFDLRRVVHNPEFLTAAKPVEDFDRQPAILIGGKDMESVIVVAEAYYGAKFQNIRVFASPKVTELAKYMHNLFLSVKVSFCNEFFDVCKFLDVEYDVVRSAALEFGGIGEGHTMVPGPDGNRGFGGMCFPKDTKAFATFATRSNLFFETLDAAIFANERVRKEA